MRLARVLLLGLLVWDFPVGRFLAVVVGRREAGKGCQGPVVLGKSLYVLANQL